MNIALSSARGRIIFSTATVDEQLKKVLTSRKAKSVELFVRPTHRPLSVPRLICLPELLSFFCVAYLMSLTANQCIIFVPSRRKCRIFHLILSRFFSCTYVYSDLRERKENIEAFRKGKYRFLISTTVMERGVTIAGVSVIIFHYAESFDQSSLVQMLGRVGRSVHDGRGKSYLFCAKRSKEVRETLDYLKNANSRL